MYFSSVANMYDKCGIIIKPDLAGVQSFIDSIFSDVLRATFVITSLISVSNGSVIHGNCKNAKQGGVHEHCEMDCDWDGKCYEAVTTEVCDCKNNGTFFYTRYNFEVTYFKSIFFNK